MVTSHPLFFHSKKIKKHKVRNEIEKNISVTVMGGGGGGGVLLGILGGGLPPGSSNPDLISDQKMRFISERNKLFYAECD